VKDQKKNLLTITGRGTYPVPVPFPQPLSEGLVEGLRLLMTKYGLVEVAVTAEVVPVAEEEV